MLLINLLGQQMARQHSRRLIYIQIFSSLVGILIVLGFLSPPASAQTIGASVCPFNWVNTVEKVASARAQLPASSNGVLFAGLDGKIFNCLDETVPENELAEIRLWHHSLALVMARTRTENPNEEGGVCDCSFHTNENGYGINICHLPHDEIELYGEPCSKRLQLFLEYLR